MKFFAATVILVLAFFAASAANTPNASAMVSVHRCHMIWHLDVRPAGIVQLGHCIQRHGFTVTEHPRFGGVHPVHTGKCHYKGKAIDVNWYHAGSEKRHLAKLAKGLRHIRHKYHRITQLFWPGYDPYVGHSGSNAHLHLSWHCGDVKPRWNY